MELILLLLPVLTLAGSQKDLNPQKEPSIGANALKDCEIKESCRRCTFQELKSNSECLKTGYKLTEMCRIIEKNKPKEFWQSLPCESTVLLEPMTLFFLLNLVSAGLSLFFLYSRKSSIFKQAMSKLISKVN